MSKDKTSKKGKGPLRNFTDGRLIIECEGCKGLSSLFDRQCLLCICNAIGDLCDVSSIVMRSSVDVAIDSDAIAVVRELSFVNGLINENRSERKGSKCNRCKCSFTALVKDQRDTFPDINFPLLRDRMTQMQFNDPVCTLCAGDTLRLLDTIEGTLSDLGATDTQFPKGAE